MRVANGTFSIFKDVRSNSLQPKAIPASELITFIAILFCYVSVAICMFHAL